MPLKSHKSGSEKFTSTIGLATLGIFELRIGSIVYGTMNWVMKQVLVTAEVI